MTYEAIGEKIARASPAIYGHLNEKGKIKELKKDYITSLKNDYEDIKEDYQNWKEYLEDNGDDYIDFAFGTYLENLILILADVKKEEMNILTVKEKDRLFEPYITYFKEAAKIRVRRWFPVDIATIIREEPE